MNDENRDDLASWSGLPMWWLPWVRAYRGVIERMPPTRPYTSKGRPAPHTPEAA